MWRGQWIFRSDTISMTAESKGRLWSRQSVIWGINSTIGKIRMATVDTREICDIDHQRFQLKMDKDKVSSIVFTKFLLEFNLNTR